MYGVITPSDITKPGMQYENCLFYAKKAFYKCGCQIENTVRLGADVMRI